MVYLFASLFLAIAVVSSACARLTRPDRNYWPMLRVIWCAIGFVYGGSAVATLMGGGGSATNSGVRMAFAAAMLGAVAYAAWFMRKRNRTPRFIRLTVGGDLLMVPTDELDRAAALVESWAHHGAMPADRAATLGVALAEWRGKEQWRRDLSAAVARRRTAGKQ